MRIYMAGLAVVFACFGWLGMPAAASAQPAAAGSTCQTISNGQVVALFDKWNKALLTKRTEAVVAEYAPDATLLPTVQNGPLIGREKIGAYFDYFLKQSPAATINTRPHDRHGNRVATGRPEPHRRGS